MLRLLRQPFPFEDSLRVKLVRAGLIGLFVGFFLAVFQPFGIQDWQTTGKTIKLFGFGLVTGLITAGHFVVWPALFPAWFAESSWTVGKMIGFISALLLTIAVANVLYLSVLVGSPITASGLIGSIGVTFLIGIFPITGAVLTSYVLRLRAYVRSADELSQRPSTPDPALTIINLSPDAVPGPDAVFTLTAETGKDAISLTASDLLLIESSDNYATVIYLKQAVSTRILLRNTLSRLEAQANRPDIVRCHRSFVVNLDRVERVTGNAQGYRLYLLGGQFVVPVARQYNATLVAKLKPLTR
jgi:hypothetical protein